jgi:hypothetical protein
VVNMLASGTTNSRVQTRPKPSDLSGEKILSMPSFGGEVKPSVPCRRLRGSRVVWLNLTGHFSPIIPPFANRGLSRRLAWSASGDERPRRLKCDRRVSASPTNRRRIRSPKCRSPAMPAWTPKLDPLSILFKRGGPLTQKPCYRRPVFTRCTSSHPSADSPSLELAAHFSSTLYTIHINFQTSKGSVALGFYLEVSCSK